MKWMANDFDRERKDHKGNSKKLIRACKKHLDESKVLKVKQKKVCINHEQFNNLNNIL